MGYPRKFGSAALTLAETLTDSNQDSTIGDADEYWTQSTATVSSINNNFAFGTNDFTIEFWYNPGYPKATEEFGTQIGQGTVLEVRDDAISGGLENGLVWYYELDGGPDTATFKFVDTVSNAMIQVSGTSSLINDTSQFFHHAITRSTNRIRIFIDGKMIANTAIAANVSIGPTSWPGNRVRLRIGGNSDSTWIPGNIDAIRISNSARFTANYNPASQGPVYNDSTALYVANFDGVLTDEYDKTWAIAPGYAEDAYLDNEL